MSKKNIIKLIQPRKCPPTSASTVSLRQQRTRPIAQNFGELIVDVSWAESA